MALSDPINVRVGVLRRQQQLRKLAAQMAARAGGRAQGAGAPFRSAVSSRGAARPSMRLPFALPENRMRPEGFDPAIDAGVPLTLPSGPPSLGGGEPVASDAADYPVVTAGGWTGAVDPVTGVPISAGFRGFDMNGQWAGDPNQQYVTQSDMALSQPMPQAYPDPWTVMTANQLPRYRGRFLAV